MLHALVDVAPDEVGDTLSYRRKVLHQPVPIPDGLPVGRYCSACGSRQSPAYAARPNDRNEAVNSVFPCAAGQLHQWADDHPFPFMIGVVSQGDVAGKVMVVDAHPATLCSDPGVDGSDVPNGWHWHLGLR